MVSGLCACSGKNNTANENSSAIDKDKKGDTQIITTESNVNIEVLGCSFDKEVMGVDEEFSNWGFTERDGKVYINLALKVTNNSDETLTKDDFKGFFELDGDEYDLQYNLATVAPKPDSYNIQPGCVGMVNMIALVDESVMDSDITVNYSIKDEEFQKKVEPIDTTDAFSKKTEVKAGDKFDVNGLYDVEVISCTEKENLTTTDEENGGQYLAAEGKKYVDLLLKIKNNTDVEMDPVKITTYTILDDEKAIRGNVRFEEKDNTEIGYNGLAPEKEEYAHFFVSVDETVKTDDLVIRFNIAGNCYYMEVE